MSESQSSGKKRYMGEILVEKGLVSQEDIKKALRIQVGGNRRLGYILIKMGLISSDNILAALSSQLDVPISRVEDEFKEEAKKILPRYLCRKYTVIPLSVEKNNVLKLAMLDPLDSEAISDTENYTGLVVQPVLASANDINSSIRHLLPFSTKDIFNPQVYTLSLKISLGVIFALILVVGYVVYQDVRKEKFGTVSRLENSTVFRNHELVVDLAKDGSVYFLGRGAFARGYYGVKFNNVDMFKSFLRTQERHLSEKQREWLNWLVEKKINDAA